MITGKVSNRKSGTPMAHIKVSDGRHIVFTDHEGRFALPSHPLCHMIYLLLLTENEGDWWQEIAEPLQDQEVDFSVTPADTADENFCFFHTSDTEINGRNPVDWVPFLGREAREHHAAFFMHTGDLHSEEGVKRHIHLMNRETMGCPVRYAIGNHDFVKGEWGEKLYESVYGPTWYSFDCGKIHFAVLSIGCGVERFHSGYPYEAQWRWLKEDLRYMTPGQKLIIFDHTLCEEDEMGFSVPFDGDILRLKENRLLAWVFGHYHIHYLHKDDGVFYICTALPDSGGIDSSEGAIRQISIHGHELTSRMIEYLHPLPPADKTLFDTPLSGHILFADPARSDGRLFIGTNHKGYPKQCGIFCLDEESGNILWAHPTKNGIPNALATDGEKVYAQDTAGVLYMLDAKSGRLLGQKDSQLRSAHYTKTGVLMVKDRIITGSTQQVTAYDKNTLECLWQCQIDGAQASATRLVYDEKREQLLVNAHWKGLYAIDIRDGHIRFRNKEDGNWFATVTPLVVGDTIYTAGDKRLIKVDAESGKTLLSRVSENGTQYDVRSQPLFHNGLLYYATANKSVVAVNPDTMETVRTFPVGDAALLTASYLYGKIQTVETDVKVWKGLLVFAASDGNIFFYTPEGEKKAVIGAGSPLLLAPLIGKDGITAFCFDGSVKKFPLPLLS